MKNKHQRKFRLNEYKSGDNVRLFGLPKQQFIIVYIDDLKKYCVLGLDGKIFQLEESHYYRIRSVQRNNRLIAKRKQRTKDLVCLI